MDYLLIGISLGCIVVLGAGLVNVARRVCVVEDSLKLLVDDNERCIGLMEQFMKQMRRTPEALQDPEELPSILVWSPGDKQTLQ